LAEGIKEVVLDRILDSTRRSLARRKGHTPLARLEQAMAEQGKPRDFAAALRGRGIGLIAEVKRASPSKGLLCPHLDAGRMAEIYSRSGAAAISVLTEQEYFQGGLNDLAAVRESVGLPLLCKDFIIDTYQVYEARSYGADAVLLIAAILSPAEMQALSGLARSLGMTALVEVHGQREMEGALEISPSVVGINNRNLVDMSVSLETTFELRPLVPQGVAVVSESGISKREDVLNLEALGVDAILVGGALVTSPDPAGKIRELLGG